MNNVPWVLGLNASIDVRNHTRPSSPKLVSLLINSYLSKTLSKDALLILFAQQNLVTIATLHLVSEWSLLPRV